MEIFFLPRNTRLRKNSQLLKMILGNEHMNDTQVVNQLKTKYNIKCVDNVDTEELFAAMKRVEGGNNDLGNYKAKSKAL